MKNSFVDENWWETFHVEEMADLFLKRSSAEELDGTITFLRQHLDLKKGQTVFDQCCGVGTLSFELAKYGLNTIGVDICDAYIQRANNTLRNCADSQFSNCEFHCEDAYHFVPSRPYDAVFNWFSSFGYAMDDLQNQQMLQRAFDGLLPGGSIALDVPNFPFIIKNFQHFLCKTGKSNGKNVTCVRQSHMNLGLGRLEQNWNWTIEGEPVDSRKSSLRIYLPHQISEMLQEVGFQDIQLFGSIDGSKLTIDSGRLLVVARKSNG